MGLGIIILIALGITLIFAIPVILVILFFKLIYKLLSTQDSGASNEEARLLQEINSKLNRLEKRIESLESIVVATDNPRQ